jgi:predicted phosphodiesterase
MRIAVISDVHGNRHALERVGEAIQAERVDGLWCLGDSVGYGPRPNECCAEIKRRTTVCLAGNHDLLAIDREVLREDFNPDARASGLWTRSVLHPATRDFLGSLAPSASTDDAQLFHASARDPVWEYVLSGETAAATLAATSARVVLVGHSHVPLAISLKHSELSGGHAPADTDVSLGAARWLFNPGSVGQPRDGDPRAAWLLLDLERGHASFRRVEYPVESTQQEMRDAGLPLSLVDRLSHGI